MLTRRTQWFGLVFQNATKYAELAMQHNRYNAKALVNKGNCMFLRGEYDHARSMYQEAMGAEADCLEAIYNLGAASASPVVAIVHAVWTYGRIVLLTHLFMRTGIVNKRLGEYAAARGLFEKLHAILPNSVEVVLQSLLFTVL